MGAAYVTPAWFKPPPSSKSKQCCRETRKSIEINSYYTAFDVLTGQPRWRWGRRRAIKIDRSVPLPPLGSNLLHPANANNAAGTTRDNKERSYRSQFILYNESYII
jgi:hypothetical protein